MHVLQLAWEFPPHVVGGMGRHVAELAPALADAGMRVSIITPQLHGGMIEELLTPNLRISRVPISPALGADYPHYVANVSRHLEQAADDVRKTMGRFDVIHAHDWLTAEASGRLKHLWQIPLVATVHATERGRGCGHLNGRAAQQINDQEWLLTYESWRVIVCSQFMSRQVSEYFQTPADKIDIVPNGMGVPANLFVGTEDRLAFRRRFAADDERLVFYVGRMVSEKGIHILLDAWPQIASAKARLLIAGTGSYLNTLQSQAELAGLGEQVRFLGFVSNEDRDKIYQVADVAAFPSLYEPFGMVALEAFAAGCPLVVSAAGGLAEVVRHGETGLIVPVGNAAALADAVLECMRHPDAARARAATALREVRGSYAWDRIAESTISVYRRVLGEWQTGIWGK